MLYLFFPFRLQYVQEFYTIEFRNFGGTLLEASWRHFGASWGLGGILEASGEPLEALEGLLGASWDLLEASWSMLVLLGSHLGSGWGGFLAPSWV